MTFPPSLQKIAEAQAEVYEKLCEEHYKCDFMADFIAAFTACFTHLSQGELPAFGKKEYQRFINNHKNSNGDGKNPKMIEIARWQHSVDKAWMAAIEHDRLFWRDEAQLFAKMKDDLEAQLSHQKIVIFALETRTKDLNERLTAKDTEIAEFKKAEKIWQEMWGTFGTERQLLKDKLAEAKRSVEWLRGSRDGIYKTLCDERERTALAVERFQKLMGECVHLDAVGVHDFAQQALNDAFAIGLENQK